jgi:hypothetical protein
LQQAQQLFRESDALIVTRLRRKDLNQSSLLAPIEKFPVVVEANPVKDDDPGSNL